MPLSWFIGLRYTGARRRSQLVSFISAISIAGLVLSVSLLVVVLSVMNGFDKELRERILTLLPQGAIYHRQGINDWPQVREHLLQQPGVNQAAPFMQVMGMATHQRAVASTLLYGVEPDYQTQVSRIDDFLPQPLSQLLSDQYRAAPVVLGSELARSLGVERDDFIRLVIPESDSLTSAPRIQRFQVTAIMQTGTEADQHLALTNLAAAQKLAGYEQSVTGIWLQLDDLFAAPSVVYQAVMSLPRGYTSTDWTRSQGNLYQAIQMSKTMVGLLLILIIAIAAFNVVSTLVMVTVDKYTDIAILRTLGASTRKIMAIFMVQGTLIGVIGTVLGLGFGVLVAQGVPSAVAWLESLIGYQFLKSDVYPISFVPVDIRHTDLVSITVVALLLSFLATLYPAWRASRVNPAEALRYE